MSRVLPHRLAAAALTAALALTGCHPKGAVQDPRLAERLVAVTTVGSAVAGDGQYSGVVGARVQSDLGFRIPGKIVQRMVDTGELVRKGQPLLRMDPTDYTHAFVAQTGNVAAAQARWIQAAADERRSRGLVTTGAISQSAYDLVKAAADSAKALLDAATAQERVAKNQEDYSLLVADAAGTVVETLAEPGQVVAAGQVVVRLAHSGPREAIVNLPETVRPAIGSKATANLYDAREQVTAQLRQLSDAADPLTRTFEARYVMSGAGSVAPLGATVTITLRGEHPGSLLSVPLGALDDEGHGPGVWLVDPRSSKVSYRLVRVHTLGAEMAAVSGDLTPGNTIVATGGHYLHEAEQVRLTTVQVAMQ